MNPAVQFLETRIEFYLDVADDMWRAATTIEEYLHAFKLTIGVSNCLSTYSNYVGRNHFEMADMYVGRVATSLAKLIRKKSKKVAKFDASKAIELKLEAWEFADAAETAYEKADFEESQKKEAKRKAKLKKEIKKLCAENNVEMPKLKQGHLINQYPHVEELENICKTLTTSNLHLRAVQDADNFEDIQKGLADFKEYYEVEAKDNPNRDIVALYHIRAISSLLHRLDDEEEAGYKELVPQLESIKNDYPNFPKLKHEFATAVGVGSKRVADFEERVTYLKMAMDACSSDLNNENILQLFALISNDIGQQYVQNEQYDNAKGILKRLADLSHDFSDDQLSGAYNLIRDAIQDATGEEIELDFVESDEEEMDPLTAYFNAQDRSRADGSSDWFDNDDDDDDEEEEDEEITQITNTALKAILEAEELGELIAFEELGTVLEFIEFCMVETVIEQEGTMHSIIVDATANLTNGVFSEENGYPEDKLPEAAEFLARFCLLHLQYMQKHDELISSDVFSDIFSMLITEYPEAPSAKIALKIINDDGEEEDDNNDDLSDERTDENRENFQAGIDIIVRAEESGELIPFEDLAPVIEFVEFCMLKSGEELSGGLTAMMVEVLSKLVNGILDDDNYYAENQLEEVAEILARYCFAYLQYLQKYDAFLPNKTFNEVFGIVVDQYPEVPSCKAALELMNSYDDDDDEEDDGNFDYDCEDDGDDDELSDELKAEQLFEDYEEVKEDDGDQDKIVAIYQKLVALTEESQDSEVAESLACLIYDYIETYAEQNIDRATLFYSSLTHYAEVYEDEMGITTRAKRAGDMLKKLQ